MTGAIPLVSVILPVYNGEPYLREAIDSVLGQSFSRFELIIVNDGSSDRSGDIAQAAAAADSRVTCLQQANQGVTVARNNGIATSRGELIAFLDQDDRWTGQALALQVEAHLRHPGAGYTVAKQLCFLQPGSSSPDWFKLQQISEPNVAYLPGTLVIKRDILERVGLFDPRYTISSDADWFARAKDMGITEYVIPEVILERRIHDRNQSQQAKHIHGELLELIRASIRRKRESI